MSAVSAVSTEIITSQKERLGKEIPTAVFPESVLPKLVGKLEAFGFVALPKDDSTIWGEYSAPQVLLILDKTLEPMKGVKKLQRVTIYRKDGIKVNVIHSGEKNYPNITANYQHSLLVDMQFSHLI